MKKIFIPERFWDLFPEPNEKPPLVTVSIIGFTLQGYNLAVRESDALECFQGDLSPARKLLVDVEEEPDSDEFRLAYFFTEPEVQVTYSLEEDSPLSDVSHEWIVDEMMLCLGELAAISGRDVSLHVCDKGTVHYPEDGDTVHVVLGGRPPGDSNMLWGSYLNGVRLHPEGGDIKTLLAGIADGYGKVVKDKFNHKVAQVVGSTLYLCLPVSEDRLYLLTGDGANIFRTALQLAWKAFVSKGKSNLADKLDEKQFVKYCYLTEDAWQSGLPKKLKEIDEEIERYSAKIQNLLLERTMFQKRAEGYHGLLSVSDEQAKAAWKKLSTNPLVDFLERSEDDNLHIHTRDILQPDAGGQVRNLGRFIVRIVRFDKVKVWSKRLTHSERVPHPHISKYGSVCFGNITSEINQLIAKADEAELACLVLAWLSEGYEAGLADAKLEEWPLDDELDEASVLDLSSTFCAVQRDDKDAKSDKKET